jgi:hypothetical protein
MKKLTSEKLLSAYIRTGLKPLWGAKDWFDKDHPETPTKACPVGVMCVDAGTAFHNMDSTQLYEHFREPFNGCWVDGFVAGWEASKQMTIDEADQMAEHEHGYTDADNPEGLDLYREGFENGQQIRQEFINLGLRA